ncbi:MAG: carboxypeptidase regulatory-like domain-containing protein [Halioglobus sp.]
MKSYTYLALAFVASVFLTACDDNSSDRDNDDNDQSPTAAARTATSQTDLLQGPLARGKDGDFVLENDSLRIIIQQPGRNWFGMGTYGGNIIDASARLEDGSFNPDHLEEFLTGINIENTANYTEIEIRNNGDDGAAAMVCATGPDDLLELANISSIVTDLGGSFPAEADDRDLPLEIETCYSLGAEDDWVTIDTTLRNTSAVALPLYLVEYLTGSGEVEIFQPNAGFGEPQGTTACPAETAVSCADGSCDQCNYVAYTGNDGAAGVSYGFIHEVPSSTTLTTVGVTGVVLGQSVLDLILGGIAPNFEVPGSGELSLRRYFAVGDGNASSIADIRNTIFAIDTGDLSGTVTSNGEPLANADVSIFNTLVPGLNPPIRFVAGHSRTDANGNYSMTLPPGDYEIQAYAEGFLYASDEPATISIGIDQSTQQDFDLPAPGFIHVDVTEVFSAGSAQPTPAKVQLVGLDPSPPLKNNVLGSTTGVFGDDADRLPFGIVLVDFVDRSGSSNVLPIEPGDYQLVVSRGPRYSAFTSDITIVSGQTTEVQAMITRVVDTPQVIYGDFHVHSIDSLDSEVTRQERVATYLAEGMDFFTPSDHSIRVDFTDTLMEMDVSDLIGTASSGEITTFDYGHFNSWPVTVDPALIGGGSIDWGREAAPGMDFPEYGSYVLSPAEIYSGTLADPAENIIQINHIGGHFGKSGLAIDTGMTPPQSQADPAQKRLDPNLVNGFDDNFQALEIWIGTDGRRGILDVFLGENMGDWFNLINQGIVRTGVANSDTHDRRITYLSTRNLIASAETDPGKLSAMAEELAGTVAQGKVAGSNGPFITIGVTGTYAGITTTAGLGINQSTTVPIANSTGVSVEVILSTPQWAEVDTVDFYLNNQPERTTADGLPARYGVCTDFTVKAGDDNWQATDVTVIDNLAGATRTDITVQLELPGLTEDSWLVAVAHGTDGISRPMFPVIPEDLATENNQSLEDLTDGNLDEEGVLAYAFTNPVFIDVDGDGWFPPGVMNTSCTPEEAP